MFQIKIRTFYHKTPYTDINNFTTSQSIDSQRRITHYQHIDNNIKNIIFK